MREDDANEEVIIQDRKKLMIMVSSAIYGIEELLDRIYTLLTAFGYEVWISHKGTIPVSSNRSAFENCIAATENCELFLGLITPHYGSRRGGDRLIYYASGVEASHRAEQTTLAPCP